MSVNTTIGHNFSPLFSFSTIFKQRIELKYNIINLQPLEKKISLCRYIEWKYSAKSIFLAITPGRLNSRAPQSGLKRKKHIVTSDINSIFRTFLEKKL